MNRTAGRCALNLADLPDLQSRRGCISSHLHGIFHGNSWLHGRGESMAKDVPLSSPRYARAARSCGALQPALNARNLWSGNSCRNQNGLRNLVERI